MRIETGRYSNLKVEERTCLVCNSSDVENEEHFLFNCNFYSAERARFETELGCTFNELSIIEKFKTVFEHPYKLARFVKDATNKRKMKLYCTLE